MVGTNAPQRTMSWTIATVTLTFSALGVPFQARVDVAIRAMQTAFVNATIAAIPSVILDKGGYIMEMHASWSY